jgi:hypothetical protein
VNEKGIRVNEEPARFIRYAALASIMYRTLHLLRLFSVSSCLKITHSETYSGRIWKDVVHQCKVLDITSVFPMKIPQDAHIGNVFFCQNPAENCTQIFLRFDVNRDKSDVMTYFGMIDWSDVCRVFRQPGSSLHLLQSIRSA